MGEREGRDMGRGGKDKERRDKGESIMHAKLAKALLRNFKA